MTTPAPDGISLVRVALPNGDADISVAFELPDSEPWAVLALAHGAGSAMQHPFLMGFANRLRDLGVATVRFNFPYSEADRRMPGPAAHAVATWGAVQREVTALTDVPFFAAGKSYGGRMASMAAAGGVIDPAGLIYLGYPLHPPGQPEKPRVEHLPAITQRQLFVEGTNDPFIDPRDQLEAAVAACRSASIVWIEGGGHSFEVKGRRRVADEVGAGLAPTVVEWMRT